MQLYIDSSNLEEIQQAFSWGVIDGITTNPSLIKKEVERLKATGQAVDMITHIKRLLQIAGPDNPVSLEVTGTTAEEMITQGKRLYNLFNNVANNVVIKIPINPDVQGGTTSFDGLKAIKALEEAGIPVNCTLIFTPEQALLAAKAGATYVSPFTGRIDDYLRAKMNKPFQKNDYYPSEGDAPTEEDEIVDDNGIVSGVDLVEKIVDLFTKHDIDCNVLAASIRNPRQVREVALAGADIATVPFAVLKQLVEHYKTREGMKRFIADIVPEYQSLLTATTGASSQQLQSTPSAYQHQQPTHQQTTQQQSSQPQTNHHVSGAYGQRPQGL